MTPGDIVMMLNEMGGMRVQATSPSLGAASVRIQGMRGRYTRFLSDGLPLFGEQVGGLGLLQIPPMDLGQVEVIKGVASALYGAGRDGRRREPRLAAARRQSRARAARQPLDARRHRRASPGSRRRCRRAGALSVLGGGHWQQRTDVDDDAGPICRATRAAWSGRALFWDGGNGRSFFATAGMTVREPRGRHDRRAACCRPTGAPYREALDTRGVDAGAVGQTLRRRRDTSSPRARRGRTQRHDHQFGEVARARSARHRVRRGDDARRRPAARRGWPASRVERDAYRPRDVPRFAYTFYRARRVRAGRRRR